MASKRHVRAKSCGSKQRHATEAEAIAHISSLIHSDHGHTTVYPPRPYKCRFCGFFHVGH